MGYTERGLNKRMFKSYESPDESDEEEDYGEWKKRDIKHKGKKYYDGPIRFKSNYNGLGYQPSAHDLGMIYVFNYLEMQQLKQTQKE